MKWIRGLGIGLVSVLITLVEFLVLFMGALGEGLHRTLV